MTENQNEKSEPAVPVGEETGLEILSQMLKFLGPITSVGASATLIFRNTWVQTSSTSNYTFLVISTFLGIGIWAAGFWLAGKEKTKRLQQLENQKKQP